MVKKASMNLEDALAGTKSKPEEPKVVKAKKPKKKQVPMYFDPKLHEALQVICFSERSQKTSMQTLVLDGLELLFEQKGLPPLKDIISGERKIEL
jgi:hypothetical protein